ncbi:unnamed protein product [Prorocentrum cordatum]|uniref:Uncharacterized protein n=1 Tax=Prorocentrum cordatum TaxID=2364126 RepID=A0ABN9QMY6_9DINO|nr:unnamed protein product [Polarella glacialis]
MFRMGLCEDAKEVAARICEWDDQLNARVSAPTGMPQNVERIISSKSSVLRSDDHAFMNHLTLQWLRAAARCWLLLAPADDEFSPSEDLGPDAGRPPAQDLARSHGEAGRGQTHRLLRVGVPGCPDSTMELRAGN